MFSLTSRAAALLALCVVVLGAYVRIHDAGLGCPDWPGCYGQLVGVPEASHEIAAAEAAYPGSPVETGKAWKEMAHRYLAGALGLVILGLAVVALLQQRPARRLLATTCVVVLAQATLGMLTVTELLRPGIVTLHLIGGMTTLALLTAAAAVSMPAGANWRLSQRPELRPFVLAALVLLTVQIVLGGWVSTNYAGLACTDLPTCHGAWWPAMDATGFDLTRELHMDGDGQPIGGTALVAIHWAHRLGAVAATLGVLLLAQRLLRAGLGAWAAWLCFLLLAQLSLGIANVLLHLPVVLAAAHNAGAALLLMTLVWLLAAGQPARERRVFL
ncbi:MAG: heme A synthase [Rhodocyclaceae bacterium]|nr:heme A synthase [Rhodocyclaceae bacterium]